MGSAKNFYLSGSTDLSTSAADLVSASQTFLTPPAGPPSSLSEFDALGSYAVPPVPEVDLPGTFARWTSPALSQNLDVVGSPTLKLQVEAPIAAGVQGAGPAGQLVLFIRVQDVAPGGTASDIRMLTAPVRVPDVGETFTVTLPAFVHRFAAGHQLRLVVAGGSLNYRGGLTPQTVGISTGSDEQVLTLPVVGAAGGGDERPDDTPSPDGGQNPGASSTCLGLQATKAGTSGNDVIVGTEGNDVIAAGGGDDLILGLAGNDIVCGGEGDDVLKGGAGNDRLYGAAGRDKLKGGGAKDYCNGGPERDLAKKCEKAKQI